ncbi:hypothetical protein ANN_13668 [Periplaneta americana]|uniref:Uncharacterized protein n=1 Tax=Periplaneta americana TaxID=6978 RepID=A0ABQ8TK16_PERAM|nr:hypothetical protein ANN_13668 [Periplaneta americana]
MSCNLTAVRSVPGRAFSTTRCRQPGCNETETLGHVLGFCRKGELLRNNRHHRVRGAIACLLRNKGWEVHEEVHCISEDDSHRRADIIAINRQQQKAIIIDPTIRMERDLNQAHQVDQEKRAIYEPCIPYLSAKYNIPLFNWSVTGLFFGARSAAERTGTASTTLVTPINLFNNMTGPSAKVHFRNKDKRELFLCRVQMTKKWSRSSHQTDSVLCNVTCTAELYTVIKPWDDFLHFSR